MSEQPSRQVYSAANQQRMAYAPSTSEMRNAGKNYEAGGRILDSLGSIGQMHQQHVAEQQREIDTRDKHLAMSRSMRYKPEIQAAIAEANLEGDKPEKILEFVKGLDAYHNIYAEIDNPETKAQLYQALDDELWGEATNNQLIKLDADRKNLSVEALAGTIEMNAHDPEALAAAIPEYISELTDPEGYYKYSNEEVEALIMGHLEARVKAGDYHVAKQIAEIYEPKTADGINNMMLYKASIDQGIEKEELEAFKHDYTLQGDELILKPGTTAQDIESHVQLGIQNKLFSDGVDADKYRQYMLRKLASGVAETDFLPQLMSGTVQSREQLSHLVSETIKLKGLTAKEGEQAEREAVQGFFQVSMEAVQDAMESEDLIKLAQAQEQLSLAIRMRPIEVQNQLVGLATAVLPPDANPEDGVMDGAIGQMLMGDGQSPAFWDTAAQAYGGNQFAMIQGQLDDPTQIERLQDFVVFSEAFGSREMGYRMATDHQYRDKAARDPSHTPTAIEEKVAEFAEDFPPQMISQYRALLGRYNQLPIKTADEAARNILGAQAGELDTGFFEWGRPVYGTGAKQMQEVMHKALNEAIGVEDAKTGMKNLRSEDSPKQVLNHFLKLQLQTHNLKYDTDFGPDDVNVFVQPTGAVTLIDKTGLPLGGRAYSVDELVYHGIQRRKRLTAEAEELNQSNQKVEEIGGRRYTTNEPKPDSELTPFERMRNEMKLGRRNLLKE